MVQVVVGHLERRGVEKAAQQAGNNRTRDDSSAVKQDYPPKQGPSVPCMGRTHSHTTHTHTCLESLD
jgi:hypothetical protein